MFQNIGVISFDFSTPFSQMILLIPMSKYDLHRAYEQRNFSKCFANGKTKHLYVEAIPDSP